MNLNVRMSETEKIILMMCGSILFWGHPVIFKYITYASDSIYIHHQFSFLSFTMLSVIIEALNKIAFFWIFNSCIGN